jgi:tetratricopeptide (TPR) repeat protein
LSQSAKQHIKAGGQFLLNGMNDAALEEFDKAIELEPTNGQAYQLKAATLLTNRDSIEAAKCFKRAAALNTSPDENYYIAANIYYHLEKIPEAQECVSKGIIAKSKNFYLQLLKTEIEYDMEHFSASFQAAQEAIKVKDMAIAYYYSGASARQLNNIEQAKKDLEKAIIRDKNLAVAYVELASIQYDEENYDYAIDNCSMVLLIIDPENIEALKLRSKCFHKLKKTEQAITDISKAISLQKHNWKLYLFRAIYNFDMALYSNAVDDLTIAIGINNTDAELYKLRAESYENLNHIAKAIIDYKAYAQMIEGKQELEGKLQYAQKKIYDLGKESNKPLIILQKGLLSDKDELKVKENDKTIVIQGVVSDESALSLFKINNDSIVIQKQDNGDYVFNVEISTQDLDYVTLTATDFYENISTLSYPVTHIETKPPVVQLISPLAEGNNIIRLESDDNTLYIEGRVEDNSTIKEIKIDEINASFAPGDYNPRFTATIDVRNRKNISVTAIDAFGNKQTEVYEFSKDGHLLAESNPMGKTWVVIIENTDYEQFSNLSRTSNDMSLLKDALERYKISKVLHKKNMTKREIERFFALDLRDLIISNKVNSLLIWYAGHGKNLQKTGYWIPSDGRINDEYSYYNINALKASLYSYTSLTHILVISDACEAGESFSVAMRGDNSLATCDDKNLLQQKSALVLTSSNQEAALDNSLFAKTFSNSLANNPTDCIPIDAIAERISIVMYKHTAQVPQFGRISGLEDKNGTFFFIAK